MAGEALRVYLFGDQTYEFDASLRRLLTYDNALLKSFLDKAVVALRAEIHRVPAWGSDPTPKFSSIGDLLSHKRDGCLSAALEQALCTVHALAHFIWRHSDGGIPYPTSRDSIILGVCTGALAAAAVSMPESLYDLVPRAVQAVVTGLLCGLTASNIAVAVTGVSAGTETSCSWSWLLPGQANASELIEEFNTTHDLTRTSGLFPSALSLSGMTVSGPPSVLARLGSWEKFRGLSHVVLPIRAPYTPRIFSGTSVSARELPQAVARPRWTPIPVISCGTGQSDWSTSFGARLEAAVRDILTRVLDLDKALDLMAEAVRYAAPAQVKIVPIGTLIGESVHGRLIRTIPEASVVLDVAAALEASTGAPLYGSTGRSKIAVIGMSGRFPGAADTEALWQLLMNKVDMCHDVPASRWDVESRVDPRGKEKNKSNVRYGCWLDNPDLFDARFFAMSPREAPQIDPAQRVALLTAYEAMENAGVVPGRTPSTREDRVGIFYGVASNDWCEANSNQDIDTYFIPGANRAFIPGRINYCFKFSGPSYAVDTASPFWAPSALRDCRRARFVIYSKRSMAPAWKLKM